jgi:ferritin-like metal-binding protein YciE
MPDTLDEQLTKYLTDVHSIEEQALRQLRTAPKIAGDPELARTFGDHLIETEGQERRVRERLEARGAEPSKTKDLLGRAGGIGMLLFARSQPDTPGKLTAHAFSYEHMEIAAYDLLAIVADRAGDRETGGGTTRRRSPTSWSGSRCGSSQGRRSWCGCRTERPQAQATPSSPPARTSTRRRQNRTQSRRGPRPTRSRRCGPSAACA